MTTYDNQLTLATSLKDPTLLMINLVYVNRGSRPDRAARQLQDYASELLIASEEGLRARDEKTCNCASGLSQPIDRAKCSVVAVEMCPGQYRPDT